MSMFFGGNSGDIITPEEVSKGVLVIGRPRKPSNEADVIFAGRGDDVVAGGGGDDLAFLGAGNDRFIWNPGDGSDLVDGQRGFDTLEFNGSAGNEKMEIFAKGGLTKLTRDVGDITMTLNSMERIEIAAGNGQDRIHVRDLSHSDVREVSIDLAGAESINAPDGAIDHVSVDGTAKADVIEVLGEGNVAAVVGGAAMVSMENLDDNDELRINAGDGDDTVSASTLSTGVVALTLDGGAGNDTLLGSRGADKLIGGDGNDLIDGNQGNDIAFMGAGDDRFVWDPGDGSDVVEGEDGFDTMQFNGAGASERVEISANGERSRFFRDPGAITMDMNSVEAIEFNALGGADEIVVRDLTGTGTVDVVLNMAGALGGADGDGQVDSITLEGGNDNEFIDVLSNEPGQLWTSGLSAGVSMSAIEAGDRIQVNAMGGDDFVSLETLSAAAGTFVVDGGAGDDYIVGSQGNDVLYGGEGNDLIVGHRGNDTAYLGAGDDEFVWNPGDGSDVVEGGEGFDEMFFVGSGANERIELSANGERSRVFRDVGNIVMDNNDVEVLSVVALGGEDNIVVNDFTGTDVQEVRIDLAAVLGGDTGDGAVDTITIKDSEETSFIEVVGSGTSIAVIGTPSFISVDNLEANDRVVIEGNAGDDSISMSSLQAGLATFTVDGGAGDDFILGGAGNELLIGGEGDDFIDGNRGDDVVHLGAGDDIFVWDPGDGSDVVEGGEGNDSMSFRGNNADETIDISANGERVRFFRDVANVTMDTNDLESITFNAFGGADVINVGDMSGTDLTRLEISLIGGSGQANDRLQDRITLQGSAANESVTVTANAGAANVTGMPTAVQITGADVNLDLLTVNTGAGDDVIDVRGVSDNALDLIIDGGAGDDVIVAGPDTGDLVIQGFVAGAGTDDRLDLREFGTHDFDWVLSHAVQVGNDVILDFEDHDFVLKDVQLSTLHNDDFLL